MDPARPLVLVVGGLTRSLVDFRGPLLDEFISRGWRVVAAAGDEDEATVAALAAKGIDFVRLPLARSGMNPFADIVLLAALARLMRRVRPTVFFGYTLKPAAYGVLAARLTGVSRRVAMISGLGYSFTGDSGLRRRIARLVATMTLRLGLLRAERVIFHNDDDRDAFVRLGLVSARRAEVVGGSGVDMDHFRPAPLPQGPVTFLLIARLLREKGLREFAAAAGAVKRDHPSVRFVLVGPDDPSPGAIKRDEVDRWVRDGLIEYRGEVRDVRPDIAACHVYVLPSYREGMPRTVLEAMAMGRAVITTDVPGCRETVVDGWNGLLVPARDSAALADACRRLAGDQEFTRLAGTRSLDLVRRRFDASQVSRETATIVLGVDQPRSERPRS